MTQHGSLLEGLLTVAPVVVLLVVMLVMLRTQERYPASGSRSVGDIHNDRGDAATGRADAVGSAE